MNSIRLWLLLFILLATACAAPDDQTAAPAVTTAETPSPAAALPTNTLMPTAAPPTTTPAPPPDVAFAAFRDPILGYSLRYPDTWITSDRPFQLFTSTPDFVDGVDAGEEGALALVIPLNSLNAGGQTLLAILEDTLNSLAIGPDPETLEPARVVERNGQQTATTSLRGVNDTGNDLTAVYTVYRDGAQLLLLLTVISTPLVEEYAPLTAAIRDSFRLIPIEVAAAAPPVQFTSFVSDDGRFAFAHPRSWQVAPAEPFFNDEIAYATATSAGLLDGLQDDESGASVRISLIPAAALADTDDPELLLGAVVAATELPSFTADSDPPQIGAVAGLPSAAQSGLVLDGDRQRRLLISVAPAGDRVLVLLGQTPAETESIYAPIFAQIAGSLVWTEASLGGFEMYAHPERPLTFHYPADWAINDDDPDGVLMASGPETLAQNDFTAGGFTFIFSDAFESAQDPVAMVQLFADNFSLTQNAELFASIMQTEINGREAATAVYRTRFNDVALLISYTAVTAGGQVTVIASTLPENDAAVLLPVQALIANSVQLGE